MVEINPHDLLKIDSIADLTETSFPEWVKEIFPKSLTVVVRRSPIIDQKIPVGIRGIKREQRFATYLGQSKILKVTTPYDLVKQSSWNDLSLNRQQLPAIQALFKVNQILNGYDWGISGSVGFELATKTPTAKITSDLDLVWRPQTPISKKSSQNLLQKLNQYGVHADLQVIQEDSGFSLEEYANSSSTIMMKTIKGPILVEDPWQKR